MKFKSFNSFVNEVSGFGWRGGYSMTTNTADQLSTLKQVNPDYEDEDDEDRWNPSIINKFAASDKDGVAHVSRKVSESSELEVGIAVEMEHTKDPKIAEKIAKDHIAEDPNYYSKLYKAGLIDEPTALKLVKKLSEGGFGDNEVAGQPVYTQSTDRSKQGYQDSMYHDKPQKEHPEDCECPLCQ